MVRKIIAIIMTLNMVLFSMNIVNAASGSASLNASNTSVKPGETFTITISAKSNDGINGIDTTYSYDTDKLELVSENVANNKWVSMGSNSAVQVICNTTSKVTSDNIYILTFKVKNNAAAGTTAKVSTSDIKVDSDVSTSSYTEGAKTITINIISQSSNAPSNNGGTQSPSTSGNNNANNQNLGTNSNNKNSSVPSSSSNLTKRESSSVSNGILPKTGKTSKLLVIFIIIVSIYSIISYIKMIQK